MIPATLVLQGLTLPWLIRRLGLHRDDGEAQDDSEAQEELRGCLRATDAALARLEELAVKNGCVRTLWSGCGTGTSSAADGLKARAGYLADNGA